MYTQYFIHILHTPSLPHLMTDDLRNATAHNVFYADLISDVTYVNEISQLICKQDTKNTFRQIVKEYNLNRKTSRFHSIADIQLHDSNRKGSVYDSYSSLSI